MTEQLLVDPTRVVIGFGRVNGGKLYIVGDDDKLREPTEEERVFCADRLWGCRKLMKAGRSSSR